MVNKTGLLLNDIDKRILKSVLENPFSTTAQVSKEARVSWNTALGYLKKFEKKGWVQSMGDTTKYWEALV